MNYLYLILILVIAVLGFWVWYLLKNKKENVKGGFMPELIEKQAKEKEQNKQKILKFLEISERVANNDVEKLLGVSNATAERYLDELERKGVLKQVGKTGKYVYYVKV